MYQGTLYKSFICKITKYIYIFLKVDLMRLQPVKIKWIVMTNLGLCCLSTKENRLYGAIVELVKMCIYTGSRFVKSTRKPKLSLNLWIKKSFVWKTFFRTGSDWLVPLCLKRITYTLAGGWIREIDRLRGPLFNKGICLKYCDQVWWI